MMMQASSSSSSSSHHHHQAPSSMIWSAIEGGGAAAAAVGRTNHGVGVGAGAGSAAVSVTTAAAAAVSDPAAMLHSQLASALSAVGDAQFWEESISPAAIRQSLQEADPSNPNQTATLLRGMKWLLASISKGRDVSDFYSTVVKLVGAASLEVRKMVYMFLVQYANYSAETRELSLLSINSFQRGMSDAEPLIRALALRVLTSILLRDILQIQILAVQKSARDESPYVRKCAAGALAKLYARCDSQQREVLREIMQLLLDGDASTMVLTSALIAFSELCPDELHMLHGPFRKICHLLTDMDEWGQVVVIELLARYVRRFFREPVNRQHGTAERIDRERRVRRTVRGIVPQDISSNNMTGDAVLDALVGADGQAMSGGGAAALSPKSSSKQRSIVRRVAKKGFYSDEEDESTDDDEEDDLHENAAAAAAAVVPTAAAAAASMSSLSVVPAAAVNMDSTEDDDLAEDHKLVLQSAMPLLKSRNAATVLAVCSLQYYCGVSSIKVRSSMGKALVRIHRSHREIQYVVLESIKTLAAECPSAFLPYLNDFFVKAHRDPPFTRMIKLDILVTLALEPAAIEAVLKELRTYCRFTDDANFVTAAVAAVGRVAEMARIVYERHGRKVALQQQRQRAVQEQRAAADRIALNSLAGLLTLTQTADSAVTVGQAVTVMQRILHMLSQQQQQVQVRDPNCVQERSRRRMILLLIRTLHERSAKQQNAKSHSGDEDDNDDEDDEPAGKSSETAKKLESVSMSLPASACAAALWMVGEYLSLPLLTAAASGQSLDRPSVRSSVVQLLQRSFPELEAVEKEQAVVLVSKFLVSCAADATSTMAKPDEAARCEHVLAMGRVDVNPQVRDKARCASNVLHATVKLKHDLDGLDEDDGYGNHANNADLMVTTNGKPKREAQRLTLRDAQRMFLAPKPASSSLPLEDENADAADKEKTQFRFGTLSSLVGHRARSAYRPLPQWATKNSPSKLREPAPQAGGASTTTTTTSNVEGWTVKGTPGSNNNNRGFYEEDSSTDEESSSSSSSSSSSDDEETSSDDDDDDSSEEESSSEDESSDDDDDDGDDHRPTTAAATAPATNDLLFGAIATTTTPAVKQKQPVLVETIPSHEDDDDESTDSSDDDDDDDDDDDQPVKMTTASGGVGNLLIPTTPSPTAKTTATTTTLPAATPATASSIADDMKGLVLAPVVHDAAATNKQGDESACAAAAADDFDNNSGDWMVLIRPERASGLSVRARYLRGAAKSKQLQLAGLPAERTSAVCLQMRFENTKSTRDSVAVIRHLRVLQRSSGGGAASAGGGSSTTIAPRRVVLPAEIEQLPPGQRADAVVGIDFAAASDRDGSCLAKLEVKFGSGGVPVEIKPALGELLAPFRRRGDGASSMTETQFDDCLSKLHGFQRIESRIELDHDDNDDKSDDASKKKKKTKKTSRSELPTKLLGSAALTVIGKNNGGGGGGNNAATLEAWKTGQTDTVRFVGLLPASGDPVYVKLYHNGTGGSSDAAVVTVCCDHALVVNSIMNLIKRAAAQ